MSISELKREIPDFAKDLRINIGNVLDIDQAEGMTEQQIWLTALATALTSKNTRLIEAISAEAGTHLDEQAMDAARSASAIMGMNNIYYRFLHLASNDQYQKMPAKLRMSVIGNPGIDKVDFELVSLAVSAVTGCGLCVDSHEKILLKAGMRPEVIQHSVRIASVIHAVAGVLETKDIG